MRFILMGLAALVLSACAINNPVTVQSVVDDRPLVTFSVSGYDIDQLQLSIDNLDYGPVSQYLNMLDLSEAALRIIPGQHLIVVFNGRQLIYQRDVYLGESSTLMIRLQQ